MSKLYLKKYRPTKIRNELVFMVAIVERISKVLFFMLPFEIILLLIAKFLMIFTGTCPHTP